MENLAGILAAADAGQLRIRCVALLAWYDGPLEGVAEVEHPRSYWYFRIVGEQPRSDDVDDRLFLCSALTADAAQRAIQLVDASAETDQDVAELSGIAPSLFIQTRDFTHVERAWQVSVHARTRARRHSTWASRSEATHSSKSVNRQRGARARDA